MTWTDASLLRHAEFVLAGVLMASTNHEWRSAHSWAEALHADIVAHHAAFDAHCTEQDFNGPDAIASAKEDGNA